MRTRNVSYLGTLQGVMAAAAVLLASCGGGSPESKKAGPVELKGAGATAPYVAYAKWIEEYRKEYPGVNLTYEPVGSGEGIQRLEAGTVDFAASDYPLTDEETAKYFSKGKVLHFPALVTSIVPVYNQAGLGKINFTGAALAGIFSGRIKTWNHPELATANPGVALPAAPIIVVHRSDASGSTHTFTDYLAQVDPGWKSAYGVGATIKWPVGQAAQGSAALATLVQKTPHSIGYVELNYANQNSLTYGNVKNAAGKFMAPSFEAQGAALAKIDDLSKDFRASIVNAPSPQAYPICTMTWLIVPSKIADAGKRNAMRGFLRFAFGPGLKIALPMDYTVFQPPLIDQVRDLVIDIN